MRVGIPLAILAACSIMATSALAGDPVAAEALFRRGRDAMRRGDYGTACELFAESQRLDAAAGTLLNLGECKERLALVASAWQRYREAADGLVGKKLQELALERMAAVEPRLSKLTIRLAATAPGDSTVTRDGVRLRAASLNVALPVDPGKHLLVVTAPGRKAKEFRVQLAEAQAETVVVEPGAQVPSREGGWPEREPFAPERSSPLLTGGFIVGSVGLLSLVAGIVTGVMTIDRKDAVDENCQDQICNATGVDAASEGRTLSAVSTTTFIVGLAALGAGGVLFVVHGSESSSTTAFGPAVWSTGAGVRVGGSF